MWGKTVKLFFSDEESVLRYCYTTKYAECVQNKTLPCALPFRTFAEIHTTSQEIDVRGPGGPWLQK